jgi:hypothetical protein
LPKKEKRGIDVSSPFFNENNNDKGVNIMFPLVCGGFAITMKTTRGTLRSPSFLTPITKTMMVKG